MLGNGFFVGELDRVAMLVDAFDDGGLHLVAIFIDGLCCCRLYGDNWESKADHVEELHCDE